MYNIEIIENDIVNSKIYEMEDFPIPCGRNSFYRDCMEYCKDKNGLFLEFGVYQGGTINFMSSLLKNKTFYGFDSFEGLPEDWDLEDKIEDDCLIIFDDLINFPDYKSHSIKAFSEFLNRSNYEYIPNGIVIKEEFSRASFIIKKKK